MDLVPSPCGRADRAYHARHYGVIKEPLRAVRGVRTRLDRLSVTAPDGHPPLSAGATRFGMAHPYRARGATPVEILSCVCVSCSCLAVVLLMPRTLPSSTFGVNPSKTPGQSPVDVQNRRSEPCQSVEKILKNLQNPRSDGVSLLLGWSQAADQAKRPKRPGQRPAEPEVHSSLARTRPLTCNDAA